MAETQLKVGDVVQLKSGGPKMTVESDESAGAKVSCVWFANTAHGPDVVTRDVFESPCLKKKAE